MQSWNKTAAAELSKMRATAAKLPLHDLLQEPARLLQANRQFLTLIPPQSNESGAVGMLVPNLDSKASAIEHLLDFALAAKLDCRVGSMPCDEILAYLLTAIDRTIPPSAALKFSDGNLTSEEKIDTINKAICGSRDTIIRNVKELLYTVTSQTRTFFLNNETLDRSSRELEGLVVIACDVNLGIRYINAIASALTMDEVESLRILTSADIQNAKRYERLRMAMPPPERYGAKRTNMLRTKLSLACPKTMAEFGTLHAEWEAGLVHRFVDSQIAPFLKDAIIIKTVDEMEQATARPSPPAGRSYGEDAAILRQDFPNLFRKMQRPNPKELEARAFRNSIRKLMRQGIPDHFIYSSLHRNLFDAPAIKSHWESNQRYLVEQGKEPERPKSKPPVLFTRPLELEVPVECPKSNGSISKHGFIASIKLTTQTCQYIHERGFKPEDIIFSVCKGFEFGKGMSGTGGAVGNAHYRGVHVRNNIRRYLQKSYSERGGRAPDEGDIVDFLKSIDLVRTFGSGPTTKTKDDAMAINTGPSHPVGRDIFATMNAAFVNLRRGS